MERAEVEAFLEEQAAQFMKPQIVWLTTADLIDNGMFMEEEVPGWYHRLSAPGYLDCTDWSGPFQFRADAEEDCADVYGE